MSSRKIAKLIVDFFRQIVLFFVCSSVRIGKNLLNEVPVERSTLAYFANCHLSSLNRRIICKGPYGPKAAKADVKELSSCFDK